MVVSLRRESHNNDAHFRVIVRSTKNGSQVMMMMMMMIMMMKKKAE